MSKPDVAEPPKRSANGDKKLSAHEQREKNLVEKIERLKKAKQKPDVVAAIARTERHLENIRGTGKGA